MKSAPLNMTLGVMRILAPILFAVNLSAQATRAYDENP